MIRFGFILIVFLINTAHAATHFVPQQYSSIQSAIDASEDGDLIQIAAGTYYEAIVIEKSVHLRGSGREGPGSTTIDASGFDTSAVAIPGQGHNVTIEQLHITGGSGSQQGFEKWGGGLFVYDSTVVLRDILFTNNRAGFLDLITGEKASGRGGAAFVRGEVLFEKVKFINNIAEGHGPNSGGGAIHLAAGNHEINGCEFYGNKALSVGIGAAVYSTSGDFLISNSVFVQNFAQTFGGAIAAQGSFLGSRIINNTFVDNESVLDTAIRFTFSSNAEIKNNIFLGHEFPFMSATGETHELSDNWEELEFNLDGSETMFVSPPHPGDDQQWGTADDHFGDLSPKAGSSFVDAGEDNWFPVGLESEDLYGNDRFQGESIDIGAVESSADSTNQIPCPSDISPAGGGNGWVNIDDVFYLLNIGFGLCQDPTNCPGDVTGNGVINTDDLTAVINQFGQCPES